jgi:hypothetical protein
MFYSAVDIDWNLIALSTRDDENGSKFNSGGQSYLGKVVNPTYRPLGFIDHANYVCIF